MLDCLFYSFICVGFRSKVKINLKIRILFISKIGNKVD